jgi:hypothetical protein
MYHISPANHSSNRVSVHSFNYYIAEDSPTANRTAQHCEVWQINQCVVAACGEDPWGEKMGWGLHRQSQSPQSFRSYLISFILGPHLFHILLIIASNDQSRGDFTKPITRGSLQCPLLARRQYLNRHNSTSATFLDQWQAQGESAHTISKELGFVHLLWRSVPDPPDQNPKQTATRVAQNRDNS